MLLLCSCILGNLDTAQLYWVLFTLLCEWYSQELSSLHNLPTWFLQMFLSSLTSSAHHLQKFLQLLQYMVYFFFPKRLTDTDTIKFNLVGVRKSAQMIFELSVSRDFSHVSLVALSVTNPVLDTEQKFNKYTLKLIVWFSRETTINHIKRPLGGH